MIEHAIDGMGHWIGHVLRGTIGLEADLLGDGRTLRILIGPLTHDQMTRHTDHCGIGWHVLDDNRIGADAGTVANNNGAEDLGTGADDDIVTQRRMTLALLPAGTAQSDTVLQRAIVAYLRRFTNHHAHAMIDEETPADRGAGMYFNAGQPTP